MRILITCGPSYEPLDQVRRITNASTGRLGVTLANSPTDALDKAWRQIREAHTDACVLNGSAYGKGFAFCQPPDQVQRWEDLPALCRGLQDWLVQASDRTSPEGHHTGAPAVPRRPRRSRSPIRQDLHAHAR